jgi:hypothetical protein
MSEITLQLPDSVLERLRDEALRLDLPLESVISTAILHYLDDDDEPNDEEILLGLREAMLDVFAGNTRPASESWRNSKQSLG